MKTILCLALLALLCACGGSDGRDDPAPSCAPPGVPTVCPPSMGGGS